MLGALNARTLVVDKSSSGAEISLRWIGPSRFLVLEVRTGDGIEISGRRLRLVKALARSIAKWSAYTVDVFGVD